MKAVLVSTKMSQTFSSDLNFTMGQQIFFRDSKLVSYRKFVLVSLLVLQDLFEVPCRHDMMDDK